MNFNEREKSICWPNESFAYKSNSVFGGEKKIEEDDVR